MEQYKNIFQLEMLKEINQKLNYLQSDDYKQQYEKAYKYQESIATISNKELLIFSIIWIVVSWLAKASLYRWFFQGGWITKGIIITFLFLTLTFVLAIGEIVSKYLKRSSAKNYVSQHPECEDIWKSLTENGKKLLDSYH